MTDDRTCKCLPLATTMDRALAGKEVPACREHGTFGYAGHKTEPAPDGAPPALNSEALETSLAATLGAVVNADRGNPFTDQPNL